MPELSYNWKRYWYPHGSGITLLENGFLPVPDKNLSVFEKYNDNLVFFDAIANIPCLILLGEPGIGKSRAMKHAVANSALSGAKLDIDLARFGSEERLERELFENDTFLAWISGDHPLYLYLDSLDESRLRVDTITELLVDTLKEYPECIPRLYLRLACRTADWPDDFEAELKELWNEKDVQAYELAPLQQQDVIEAAKQHDRIDSPPNFLHEILEKEVGPLAANPVTLEMLIGLYIQNKRLPVTRYEVYLEGCKKLCHELNQRHKKEDKLDPEQRLAVAARIAACTVFAGHSSICGESANSNYETDDECVPISQLVDEPEGTQIESFRVYRQAVEETLKTALFRGSLSRREWAHHTYAEFLAAWYVKKYMQLPQIKNLLFQGGRVVLQLGQTAAWLASSDDRILREVVNVDPQILTGSDVIMGNVETRTKLIEALLRQIDAGQILNYGLWKRHSSLSHSDLSVQLKPYLEDVEKNFHVRSAAIEIAEIFHQHTIQNILAGLALDDQERIEIRECAARAVFRIGDEQTKARLKPLALIPLNDKEKSRLKEYGVEATWPDHISAQELFATLDVLREEEMPSVYYLSEWVTPRLDTADLPVALAWVKKQPQRHQLSHACASFMDSIIFKSWAYLDIPEIANAFTKAALKRVLYHDPIIANNPLRYPFGSDSPSEEFKQMLHNDDGKRRQILSISLPILAEFDPFPRQIAYSDLIISKDTEWLVQRFNDEESEDLRLVLCDLIVIACDWQDPEQFDFIYNACKNNPSLEKALAYPFDAEPLDSPKGQQFRQMQAERVKIERERAARESRSPIDPPPKERVLSLLEECEADKPEAWWKIIYWMMVNPDSSYNPHHDEEPILDNLPMWGELNEKTKSRIVEAGKNYILVCDPNEYDWLNSSTDYRPVVAGYRAFLWLLNKAPEFILSTVSQDAWQRWASVIIYYAKEPQRKHLEEQEMSLVKTLRKLTYQNAPAEIIGILIRAIDSKNDIDYIKVTRGIDDFWDEHLASAIFEKIQDKTLKPQRFRDLLEHLLKHRFNQAEAFAKTLLSSIPTEDEAKERSIAATCLLLRYTHDAGWPAIWPAFQQDNQFGKEVILKFLPQDGRFYSSYIGQKLTVMQLSSFYIWLANQFPHDQYQKLKRVGLITEEHELAGFRDSMLRHLQEQGTKQAIDELQIIATQFPEADLSWEIIEACKRYRQSSWQPPKPDQILELARKGHTRWIQDGSQLLDAIIESLEKLNREFRGQDGATPTVFHLWNEKPVNTPKDENRVSDYIETYLKQEFEGKSIFLGREVQPRRGNFTDVFVETFIPLSNGDFRDKITIVIEVKGCWHDRLKTAMKTQLVNRYLVPSGYQHGLYLVGWFLCDEWDKSDSRKGKTPKWSFEETQVHFVNQAETLSISGLDVRSFVLDVRWS
jgi:hypothetical protein